MAVFRRGIKSLGELLVAAGLVSEEQLLDALAEQSRRREAGEERVRLGEVLVGRGVVTAEQLRKALASQELATEIQIRELAHGISAVSLTGYLDAETHTLLVEALGILMAAGHTRIVMDCRKLDFTDSRGIGDIIGCAKECRDAGGDLKFVGLRGLVRAVFEVLEMDKEFDLFETEEEAVAGFAARL